MKSLLPFVIAGIVAVFFLPLRVSAIMIGLSTERLSKESDVVIRGVVKGVTPYWSADRRTITTQTLIEINEVIRGTLSQNILTVVYPGGEIDGICLKVSDVASLHKGEKVLLFLKSTKSNRDIRQNEATLELHTIVGRAQGIYIIGDDEIARKSGFSLAGDKEAVDNNIPVKLLIQKIKESG